MAKVSTPAIPKDLHSCSSAAANLNDGASRSWVFAPLPLYWYLRDSARTCVAPSVNARTARTFLFSRHSALQYLYLSVYGRLRLRWDQIPCGSAPLFCEAVAVYALAVQFHFPPPTCVRSCDLLASGGAETVPARRRPVQSAALYMIFRCFCRLAVSQLNGMNEMCSFSFDADGATPPVVVTARCEIPSRSLGSVPRRNSFDSGVLRR